MHDELDLTKARWRKSSLSSANGQCVEIALVGDHVAVRDSKNPSGPSLVFNHGEWKAFIGGAKSGEFDCPPVM